MPTITVPETFSATLKKASRQPCSSPVLLGLSSLGDHSSTAERHPTVWLSTEERDRFSQFKLEKRKKEWLAGRICAKIAVQEYFSNHCHDRIMPACTEFSIANSATGRPLLIWNTGEPSGPDISISHSGSLALAIAARTSCGVDIQKTRDALVRVRERFCTGREEDLLRSVAHKDQPLMPLTLLWTAKEAAQKALSINEMPGFLDLVLARIETVGDKEFLFIFNRHHPHLPSEIRVATTCYRDYGLGVCIP